ncbi:MAG: hypothetical protein IKM18_01540 [Clostridia bacterium]|nr:hypothetical protein [Clostridia bacterium]
MQKRKNHIEVYKSPLYFLSFLLRKVFEVLRNFLQKVSKRDPRAEPLAGFKGRALGGIQGQSPWRDSRAESLVGFRAEP